MLKLVGAQRSDEGQGGTAVSYGQKRWRDMVEKRNPSRAHEEHGGQDSHSGTRRMRASSPSRWRCRARLLNQKTRRLEEGHRRGGCRQRFNALHASIENRETEAARLEAVWLHRKSSARGRRQAIGGVRQKRTKPNTQSTLLQARRRPSKADPCTGKGLTWQILRENGSWSGSECEKGETKTDRERR